MPLDILIGTQWGDEGKGRMVDLLSANSQYVARYSGGDNAGHTVTVGDKIFKLHLLPSGLINPNVVGILGNGMVINPESLLNEMEEVRAAGVLVNPDRVKISSNAHMITPGHQALDAAQEALRGEENKIGTTLRGIGPAYTDKTSRQGIRIGEMLDVESMLERLTTHLENVNIQLDIMEVDVPKVDVDKVVNDFLGYTDKLSPYIIESVEYVNEALESGETVLAEGAQGTLLDLDHGTYPFVTSSNPSSAGALIGLGVGPKYVDKVIGVTKAFQTRVGEGAMPTELEGDIASHLRGTGDKPWDEFGTTTGRPRRVGWLDLVLLKYSVRVNGLTHIALTKLDILSGIEKLKLCVAYEIDGKQYDHLPLGLLQLDIAKPIYESVPGWQEDVTGARKMDDLPKAAQAYIERISASSGIPVKWISVGAERDQLVKA
jgi:adenylosuccinate synthase